MLKVQNRGGLRSHIRRGRYKAKKNGNKFSYVAVEDKKAGNITVIETSGDMRVIVSR